MHRSILSLLLSCIIFIGITNSYLIKGRNFEIDSTKDVPASVSNDAIDNQLGEIKAPQCAQVGEFCMNHKDCCSNACLGFMKRCVGS